MMLIDLFKMKDFRCTFSLGLFVFVIIASRCSCFKLNLKVCLKGGADVGVEGKTSEKVNKNVNAAINAPIGYG